ncbi:hypothetical protein EIP91_005169 [Steccherinum ochraceum]|uniref:Charged multivesicular body protein 7 n=1 Tax=Steccherinum ochraceum TaxID=92696 RepID=A0A4R0RIK3_9APHY|nr:hypothetical protein EIP91_005169 [Steccherinum ochraceum]
MSTQPGSSSRLSALPSYQSVSSQRLKSLYSDFLQQKHSNPTSFASNLEWWRRTLENVVLKGWQLPSDAESTSTDRLILHANGPSFSEEFRYEGVGRPLSLAGIIAELTESKTYIPLTQFLTDSKSVYDPGWLPLRIASFVIGKPLWWALQQLNVVDSGEYVGGHAGDNERWRKVKGDYVVLALLERAAEGVLQKQSAKSGLSLADYLYKFDSFKRQFSAVAFPGVTLSDQDMRVVLKFLERDRRALVVDGEVIKFLESPGSILTEITAVDTGVLELKTGVENLQAQVDDIQKRLEQRNDGIKDALRAKRKEIALNHLRMRKQLESLLQKRLNSLETLQSTLLRVEAAAGDVEIMKSYETSAATLRAVLTHPLLQREKIEETMEAVASANDDAQQIDDLIRTGAEVAQGTTIDDSELEAELQGLVADVEAERKQREMAKLKVPSHVPQASEETWTDHEMDEEYKNVKEAKLTQ